MTRITSMKRPARSYRIRRYLKLVRAGYRRTPSTLEHEQDPGKVARATATLDSVKKAEGAADQGGEFARHGVAAPGAPRDADAQPGVQADLELQPDAQLELSREVHRVYSPVLRPYSPRVRRWPLQSSNSLDKPSFRRPSAGGAIL